MTATARNMTKRAETAQCGHSMRSPRAELLLKAARELGPVMEARLDTCSTDRRVPDETIADFHDAGFFRILQSSEYGGYEMDPQVFYAVLLEIGQRCVRDHHHGADVQAWAAAYCKVRVSVCMRALGALAGIARCRRPSAAAGDVRAALGAGQQGPSSALCSPGALARRQDA